MKNSSIVQTENHTIYEVLKPTTQSITLSSALQAAIIREIKDHRKYIMVFPMDLIGDLLYCIITDIQEYDFTADQEAYFAAYDYALSYLSGSLPIDTRKELNPKTKILKTPKA